MSTVVDTLVTRYQLRDDYTPQARHITASTHQSAIAMQRAQGLTGGLAGGFSKLGLVLNVVMGPLKVVAGALAGVAAAGIGAGIAASKIAMDLEAMKMGLVAVSGSAEEAERQLKRLAIVARSPGLGFTQSIEGSVRLQAAGMDSRLAERTLMGFGNALATVGKGKADLDGVIMALTQIASKGKVSAEEINQLAERIPQIRQIMLSVFGTASTEAIQKMGISAEEFILKIVAGLEMLPKAAGGFKNTFENLTDAFQIAAAKFGQQLNDRLLPILEKAGTFLSFLAESGVIDKLGQAFASLLGTNGENGIVRLLAYTTATLESLPQIIATIGQSIAGVIRFLIDNANKIIDLFNQVMDNPLAKVLGIDKLQKITMGGEGGLAVSLKNLFDKKISPRANELMGQFGQFKEDGSISGGEGGFRQVASDATAAKQTDLLGEIAANTAKMVDLSRNVFGGGDLGRMGVTPTELGGVKGGNPKDLIEAGAKMIYFGGVQLGYDIARNNRRMRTT